jgi:Flp pilus assembly pilin Flp
MKQMLNQAWREDDGVLSFEWTLLATLVVIGAVGGIAAARDAISDELGDVAQAMLALDGSYLVRMPLELAIAVDGGPAVVVGRASDSGFFDVAVFLDCDRTTNEVANQP